MSTILQSKKINYLSSVNDKTKNVFYHLPEPMKAKLLANKVPHKFSEGEHMQYEDGQTLGLWFIVEGHVRVGRLDESGNLSSVLIISSRDSFGELTCFAHMQEPADGVAVGNVEAYWVSRDELYQAISEFPESNQIIHRVLAEQVLKLFDFTMSTKLHDSSEKLRWGLRYFCTNKTPPIPVPLPQAELADLVGISRMTVSKELKRLEGEGVLKRSYGQMFVIRPDLLV